MIFQVIDKMYGARLKVFLNEPRESVNQHIMKQYDDQELQFDNDDAAGIICQDGSRKYILWIPVVSDKPGFIPMVGHEINHMCFHTLEQIGHIVSQGNDEIFCYLSQYLLTKVIIRIRKEMKSKLEK